MASQATSRLQTISAHLSPSSSSSSSSSDSEPLPPIPSKAGTSTSPRVASKVIIITGANSPLGIGRASAHQFAANGARALYICDYDDTYLAAQKHELETAYGGVEVHTRQLDVADEDAVKEVVDHAVKTYGRLDVFFANAGVRGTHAAYTDIEGEEFMDTMKTNVLSVFLAVKHAAPAMQITSSSKPTASGSIIATASVAGIRSNAGSTDYSASKAAVISIAQTTAYQLMRTNVRVNALCPGLIETGMTELVFKMARERGTEKKVGQLNPLGRGGVADEIARVALFLGSDESSYVNGQAWAVCGGLSAGHPFVPGRIA